MEITSRERRFLVSFAEAALGMADGERSLAEQAVDRLDQFLSAAPKSVPPQFAQALRRSK